MALVDSEIQRHFLQSCPLPFKNQHSSPSWILELLYFINMACPVSLPLLTLAFSALRTLARPIPDITIRRVSQEARLDIVFCKVKFKTGNSDRLDNAFSCKNLKLFTVSYRMAQFWRCHLNSTKVYVKEYTLECAKGETQKNLKSISLSTSLNIFMCYPHQHYVAK